MTILNRTEFTLALLVGVLLLIAQGCCTLCDLTTHSQECNIDPRLDTKTADVFDDKLKKSGNTKCPVTSASPITCDCATNCRLSSAVCCDAQVYTPISLTSLKRYAKEYRDKDWYRTSDRVVLRTDASPPGDTDGNGNYYQDIVFRTSNTTPANSMTAPDMDSRFMDITIEDMENYLCRLKSSQSYSRRNINTIRFYYIRYDSTTVDLRALGIDEDFANKHSLAIVPVSICDSGSTVEEMYQFSEEDHESLAGQPTIYMAGRQNNVRPTQNHNKICPPFDDCHERTLLTDLDDN